MGGLPDAEGNERGIDVAELCPVTQVVSASGCWATTGDGKPCPSERHLPGKLPYCSRHIWRGDEAFRKVRHPDPRLGHVLVARFSLPARYYAVFWGRCVPSGSGSLYSGRRVSNQDYLMELTATEISTPQSFPGPCCNSPRVQGQMSLTTLCTPAPRREAWVWRVTRRISWTGPWQAL